MAMIMRPIIPMSHFEWTSARNRHLSSVPTKCLLAPKVPRTSTSVQVIVRSLCPGTTPGHQLSGLSCSTFHRAGAASWGFAQALHNSALHKGNMNCWEIWEGPRAAFNMQNADFLNQAFWRKCEVSGNAASGGGPA